MNFKVKVFIQSIFSMLPYGEKINFYFSRYITKKLVLNKSNFLYKVNQAQRHYNNFLEYNKLQVIGNKYYEFGAGWSLIIPLTMSLHKFEVVCIDIRKLISNSMVRESIEMFKNNPEILPNGKIEIPITNYNKRETQKYLEKYWNVKYLAPMDARSTGFQSEYFDFISSTLTMTHIPTNDLLPIFNECYRLLKPGGIFSFTVDYQDNWSYADNEISNYNFLKYSKEEWKKK